MNQIFDSYAKRSTWTVDSTQEYATYLVAMLYWEIGLVRRGREPHRTGFELTRTQASYLMRRGFIQVISLPPLTSNRQKKFCLTWEGINVARLMARTGIQPSHNWVTVESALDAAIVRGTYDPQQLRLIAVNWGRNLLDDTPVYSPPIPLAEIFPAMHPVVC